ncbi:MAG TPA: hypothetical protein VGV12_03390 [Gemmatimonadales bacterium]|nr:hypothetical protein [Gemmatimonadales bacterium]
MVPLWLVLAFALPRVPVHRVATPPLVRARADSESTLRSARRAQRDFESFRRQHLPERYGGRGGPCDLQIGRFCFWYGDQKEDSVPEPPVIREARHRLLADLAEAAAHLPGDPWIAGQRARYLVEDGQAAEAVTAARACRSTPWWCSALAGYALHAAARFEEADSAFSAALRSMPDDERCRWHDIAPLLPGDLRGRYERMSCEERAAFESRWWWLAAPLLSRPGNDRRTEHFARLTLAEITSTSSTAYDERWDDDLREVLLRFGRDVYWTQEPSPYVSNPKPFITGHERVPAFHFVPSGEVVDAPERATPADWRLDADRPQEWYAPSYADRFTRLDAQVAAFRRSDSCVAIASYDASHNPMLAHQAALATLVMARDERSRVLAQRETQLDGPEVLSTTVTCEPQLLSLEIVPAKARWVARLRYGMNFGKRDGVSDLLLIEPFDSLPTDLASALHHVLATTRIPAGGRLGLFWEVHGLSPAGEMVTTSLAVRPQGGGWLRHTVEALGLAARRAAVDLEWDEVMAPASNGDPTVAERAITLDLAGVPPGLYRIELIVTARGRAPFTTSRDIEIVSP